MKELITCLTKQSILLSHKLLSFLFRKKLHILLLGEAHSSTFDLFTAAGSGSGGGDTQRENGHKSFFKLEAQNSAW